MTCVYRIISVFMLYIIVRFSTITQHLLLCDTHTCINILINRYCIIILSIIHLFFLYFFSYRLWYIVHTYCYLIFFITFTVYQKIKFFETQNTQYLSNYFTTCVQQIYFGNAGWYICFYIGWKHMFTFNSLDYLSLPFTNFNEWFKERSNGLKRSHHQGLNTTLQVASDW